MACLKRQDVGSREMVEVAEHDPLYSGPDFQISEGHTPYTKPNGQLIPYRLELPGWTMMVRHSAAQRRDLRHPCATPSVGTIAEGHESCW